MSAESRRRGTLSTRFAVAFIFTALFSVVVVGVGFLGLLRFAAAETELANLRRQAQAIARAPRLFDRDQQQAFRTLRPALGLSGVALYRFSGGGAVLAAGSEVVPVKELDVGALAAGELQEGRLTQPGDLVFVARPLGNPARGFVVLSKRIAAVPAGSGLIAGRLALAGVIAMSLAALVAILFARHMSGPMKELATAAAGIAKGDFRHRVSVNRNDEMGVVAESFNKMAADLAIADSQQREFFLSISHELRTPLTAIQGYAEAIEDGTLDPANHQEAAEVIVVETKRLSRLVSDLMILARIDARRFDVSMEEVEVASVLRSVRRSFARPAEEAGVKLEVESANGFLQADEGRLMQVLSNLIENALRYTPAGRKIVLRSSESNGWVEIKVVDGGVGFEPEDLARAFERQHLWRKYRGVRDVGTGLGLAICRELVQAMGGSVRAANAPGGGAEFAILLRARA